MMADVTATDSAMSASEVELLDRAEAQMKALYRVHDTFFPVDKREKQERLQRGVAEISATIAELPEGEWGVVESK